MIEINNATSSPVDKNYLKRISERILKSESASWRKKEKDLSIALVGPGQIRKLNKIYRKKNRPTDVLSFSYGRSSEIVICISEVRKNAKKYHLPFKKELNRVLIHGILHVLGYDHKAGSKGKKLMEKKENYYFRKENYSFRKENYSLQYAKN